MTGDTKIYILKYENYQGEYFTEYYLNPETAREQLRVLMNEARRESEYECNSIDYLSFFDADYNSDSTIITLSEIQLKNLFKDWEDNRNADD